MRNIADQEQVALIRAKYLHDEKLTSDERARFSKDLSEVNLQKLGMEDDYQLKTLEINTFMIKESDDKKNMMDKLQAQRQFMGRRARISNESLVLRFFKFLITKLPDRNVSFNIARGTVISKSGGDARVNKSRSLRRKSRLLISVKDPFLKREDHGFYLRDENRFNRLIIKLKQFIKEASQGRLEEFLLEAECEEDEEVEKSKEEVKKDR